MFTNRMLCVFAVLLFSSPAFAYYTIVDDDASLTASAFKEKKTVPPTAVASVLPPSSASTKTTKPTKVSKQCPIPVSCGIHNDSHNLFYNVPFFKKKFILNKNARDRLDGLIPMILKGRVCIIGRPDSLIFNDGEFSKIARLRTQSIRTYLTRKGVPAGSITVGYKNSPHPQSDGTIYSSELIINVKDTPTRVPSISGRKAPVPAAPVPTPAPVPAPRSTPLPDELMQDAPEVKPQTPVLQSAFVDDRSKIYNFINKAITDHKIERKTGYDLLRMISDIELKPLRTVASKQPSL